MGTLAADLRFALRTMRTNRGFTAVAVITLALGIGATTAMFTVVNRVMFDPLPYPEPDRIMRLGRQFPNGNGWSNSIPKYMTWRQNDVFESMALYDFAPLGMNFGGGDRPEPVKATRVSEGFFRVFGAQPASAAPLARPKIFPGRRPSPCSRSASGGIGWPPTGKPSAIPSF